MHEWGKLHMENQLQHRTVAQRRQLVLPAQYRFLVLKEKPLLRASAGKEHLPQIVHAYNCTRHEATGFSSHYLMFGRHPHLLVHLIFGLFARDGTETPQSYAKKWALWMEEAYRTAAENSQHSSARGRRTMIITHRTQSLSNLVRQCPSL